MLLVNSLDYLREDVLESLKNTFKVLGYKVTLLKDTEKSISLKKEWSGHRWCFSGKMGGNATATSTCFQRDDLLLPKNQRVSCFIGSYALKSRWYLPILSVDMSTKCQLCQSTCQLSNGLYVVSGWRARWPRF